MCTSDVTDKRLAAKGMKRRPYPNTRPEPTMFIGNPEHFTSAYGRLIEYSFFFVKGGRMWKKCRWALYVQLQALESTFIST